MSEDKKSSYKDYMKVDSPNKLGESFLKIAIKSMANAANKRLKRIEQAGTIYYQGSHDNTGKGYTAGYKRFGIAGKNLTELQNEFKRVRSFLLNPLSSITGIKEEMKKSKRYVESKKKPKQGKSNTTQAKRKYRRLTKKERKDYERMKKEQETRGTTGAEDHKFRNMQEELDWFTRSVQLYNKLVDAGLYRPTPYESNQVRAIVEQVVADTLDDLYPEEQYEIIKERVAEFLGKAGAKKGTVNTSDFFNVPSD